MKHLCKNYLCIFFAIFITITGPAQAKSNTCAEMMRFNLNIDIGVSVGIPVFGWLAGLILSPDLVLRGKRILILEAATRLYEKKPTTEGKNIEDRKRIVRFYKKLITRYPETTLGHKEVVSVLHKYNKYGVKNGTCDAYAKLMTKLFPEEKVDKFMQAHFNWQKQNARNEKIRAKAIKVRDQKNNSDMIKIIVDEVIYYDAGDI